MSNFGIKVIIFLIFVSLFMVFNKLYLSAEPEVKPGQGNIKSDPKVIEIVVELAKYSEQTAPESLDKIVLANPGEIIPTTKILTSSDIEKTIMFGVTETAYRGIEKVKNVEWHHQGSVQGFF